MPIYEYVCRKCDSKFELMRPFSLSSAPASCPTCKKSSDRVPSTFACFSVSDGGSATPVGGSSCSGCASGSCSTCGSGVSGVSSAHAG